MTAKVAGTVTGVAPSDEKSVGRRGVVRCAPQPPLRQWTSRDDNPFLERALRVEAASQPAFAFCRELWHCC
jgi:hypothetical protein